MNAGSQCQYQRPSSRVPQVLLEPAEIRRPRPVRVVALDRVGDLVERREAVVHVLGHERADAHRGPASSMRGATSTSTSARATSSSGCSPIAASDEMPPSDAPTSAGGASSVARDREHVARERVERVVAVGGPLAVAVAAQVDRVRAPAPCRRACRASCPTSAGSGRRRATAPPADRPGRRPRRPPAGCRRARRTRSVPRIRLARSCTRPRARPRRAAFRDDWVVVAAMYRPPRRPRRGGDVHGCGRLGRTVRLPRPRPRPPGGTNAPALARHHPLRRTHRSDRVRGPDLRHPARRDDAGRPDGDRAGTGSPDDRSHVLSAGGRRLPTVRVLPVRAGHGLHAHPTVDDGRQVERDAEHVGALHDARGRVPPDGPGPLQRHRRRRVAQRLGRRRRGTGLDPCARRAHPIGLRVGRCVRAGESGLDATKAAAAGPLRRAHAPGRQLLVRHLHAGRAGGAQPGRRPARRSATAPGARASASRSRRSGS